MPWYFKAGGDVNAPRRSMPPVFELVGWELVEWVSPIKSKRSPPVLKAVDVGWDGCESPMMSISSRLTSGSACCFLGAGFVSSSELSESFFLEEMPVNKAFLRSSFFLSITGAGGSFFFCG